MAEDVARAVGAASPTTVTIAGKEVRPRPLSLKELAEVERDCLKRFRRQYLEAYRDNMDLLSPAQRDRMMQEKIEETAKWDLANLPPKYAVDWHKVKLNDKLRTWVDSYLENQSMDDDKPTEQDAVDRFYKKLVGAFIDQGILSDDEYKTLAGYDTPKVKVPYVSWWITGSLDGQITMCWACFSSVGITRDEIERDPLVLKNPQKLLQIAMEIETLTAPELGNG